MEENNIIGESKTPIFNIDLKAFDTFILAIRTTDGKILMQLNSDGSMITTGAIVPYANLGYYDAEKNEIINNDLPEKPNE